MWNISGSHPKLYVAIPHQEVGTKIHFGFVRGHVMIMNMETK